MHWFQWVLVLLFGAECAVTVLNPKAPRVGVLFTVLLHAWLIFGVITCWGR